MRQGGRLPGPVSFPRASLEHLFQALLEKTYRLEAASPSRAREMLQVPRVAQATGPGSVLLAVSSGEATFSREAGT